MKKDFKISPRSYAPNGVLRPARMASVRYQLDLDHLRIGRDEFIRQLQQAGVGCSVHLSPSIYILIIGTEEGTDLTIFLLLVWYSNGLFHCHCTPR